MTVVQVKRNTCYFILLYFIDVIVVFKLSLIVCRSMVGCVVLFLSVDPRKSSYRCGNNSWESE